MNEKLSTFSYDISIQPFDFPIRDTILSIFWIVVVLFLLSLYLYKSAERPLHSMKVRGKLYLYKYTLTGKTFGSILINKINIK